MSRSLLNLLILLAFTASGVGHGARAADTTDGGAPAGRAFDTSDPAFVHRFLAPGQYLPLSAVRPGMTGYGLSVFQGTRIERFGVRVVGVMKKVLNGRDAILVRLSGRPLMTNNVIRGMSGSPVYVDGKLVGAVSFGFDFSKEPLAGLTPIVDMLDAMAPAGRQRIAARESAPWFAQAGGKSEVAGGAPRLVPLMSPVSLAGFSSRAQEFLEKRFRRLGMAVTAGGGGAQDPSLARGVRPEVAPGSALSVMLATGDFNVAATGTVTARFGQNVLAFGHPFLQAGTVDFPLATAYVHEVLPSLFVSFKLTSPAATVGSLTADRPWSVGGQLGRTARLIPATYTVTDSTRHVRRVFRCQLVDHPDLTPELLAATVMSAIDATHQSSAPYVARVASTIEAEGVEAIKRTDLFSSNFSAHGGNSSGRFHLLADPVASYVQRTASSITSNEFQRASIKGVNLEISLSDGRDTARLERVFVDRPFVAPGDQVDVRCLLVPYSGGKRVETVSFSVPRDMPDGDMLVAVTSGDETESVKKRLGIRRPAPQSLKELAARIVERGRADAIAVVAALPGQSLELNGLRLANPPAHWARIFASNRSTRGPALIKGSLEATRLTSWLLDGSHILTVEVRSREKAAARPAPFTVSVPNPDDAIVMTEQARKAIDASRKTQGAASAPAGQPGQERGKIGSGGLAETAAVKEYPHMRPPAVWRQDSEEEFRSGKTSGVTVDSRGRIGPGFKRLSEKLLAPEHQVWSGVCSRGKFYFGTTDGVWRWSGDETPPEKLGQFHSLAVPAMATDSKGTVYFATVPGGNIYALDGQGQPRLTCCTSEPIVTALACDDMDNLYAAVAGTGRVYKVAAGGAELFFDSGQAHVLSLFFSPVDHRLYVGCGEKAVVYALDQGGHATAVYESPDHLVTGAVRDARGDLYVATAGQGRLVRVTGSGQAQTIAVSEAFYRLYYDPVGDRVFSGDAEGDITLASVDPISGEPYFVPVCHTEQEAVLSLAADGQGRLYCGTANLGVLTSFAMRPDAGASYESAVRDAGRPAQWINLRAWGPLGEPVDALADRLKLETRTGYSVRPDDSWSDWQEARSAGGAFAIASPPGRCLQYRLTWLAGPGRSERLPAADPLRLGRVEVSYLPRDASPRFDSVSVKPGAGLAGKQEIAATASDPDSDNLLLSIELSGDRGRSWRALASDLRSKPAARAGSRPATTGAEAAGPAARAGAAAGTTDGCAPQRSPEPEKSEPLKGGVEHSEEKTGTAARESGRARQLSDDGEGQPAENKDKAGGGEGADGEGGKEVPGDREKKAEATADRARKPRIKGGSPARVLTPPEKGAGLAAPAEERFTWSFDTSGYKDGNYLLRLTLDDRLSSPDDHLQSVALRSIVIDNKPPRLGSFHDSRGSDGSASFSVSVSDDWTPVANGTYRIDEGEPFALAGWAQLADGMSGTLGAGGIKLAPGPHRVEVKVTDKAGNTATKTFTIR